MAGQSTVTCGDAGTGWAAAVGRRDTDAGESDPLSEFCMLRSRDGERAVGES
jgi:hypothetical protein